MTMISVQEVTVSGVGGSNVPRRGLVSEEDAFEVRIGPARDAASVSTSSKPDLCPSSRGMRSEC